MSTSMPDIKLYVQQVWNGAMTNEIDVLSAKGSNDLGRLTFFNWPIREHDGPGSPVLGHVHGICSKVSSADRMYYRNFCIVRDAVRNPNGFIAQRSTFSASGVWEYGSPVGSVAAITGGTGKYKLARGTVEVTNQSESGGNRYLELKVQVSYRVKESEINEWATWATERN